MRPVVQDDVLATGLADWHGEVGVLGRIHEADCRGQSQGCIMASSFSIYFHHNDGQYLVD